MNKIRFSNELKHLWIYFSTRKNIYVCVHVHDLSNLLSIWLIKSFSHLRHLHGPHTFQDQVQLLCRARNQGPDSLALSLPLHDSQNMNHLPCPEVTMKFPISAPLNLHWDTQPVFSPHSYYPIRSQFGSNSSLKCSLYDSHLVCNIWQSHHIVEKTFDIKCKSKG